TRRSSTSNSDRQCLQAVLTDTRRSHRFRPMGREMQSTNTTAAVERPFFLVGAKRSGTTMLRLMLDHHPRVCWFGEFEFVTEPLLETDGWPDMAEVRAWLPTSRLFRAGEVQVDAALDYPALAHSFLRQKLE